MSLGSVRDPVDALFSGGRPTTTDAGLRNLLCSSGPTKERALPDNPSRTVRRDTRCRLEQWAPPPREGTVTACGALLTASVRTAAAG